MIYVLIFLIKNLKLVLAFKCNFDFLQKQAGKPELL